MLFCISKVKLNYENSKMSISMYSYLDNVMQLLIQTFQVLSEAVSHNELKCFTRIEDRCLYNVPSNKLTLLNQMLMPTVGVVHHSAVLLTLEPLLFCNLYPSPLLGLGQYEFEHPTHSEPGEVPGRPRAAPAPTWTR